MSFMNDALPTIVYLQDVVIDAFSWVITADPLKVTADPNECIESGLISTFVIPRMFLKGKSESIKTFSRSRAYLFKNAAIRCAVSVNVSLL